MPSYFGGHLLNIPNYYVANSIATFDTIPVTEQQMLDNIRNIATDNSPLKIQHIG